MSEKEELKESCCCCHESDKEGQTPHEHNHNEHHHHEHHHEHKHHDGCNCGHSHDHSHDEDDGEELSVKALIVSAVFFVLGLLAEHLPLTNWIPVLGNYIPGSNVTIIKFVMAIVLFVAYIIPGKSILIGAVKNIFHGEFLDEAFLMSVSSLGALAIGEYPEAAAIMLLYQVGEKLEDYAVDKSRDSIAEISSLRPDKAYVKKGEELVEISAEEVKINDIIVVKPGDRIPVDGIIITGESFVDTSALTGESVPRKVCAESEVLSGSINKQGVIEIKATHIASESALARIINLVENAAQNKTKSEQFVSRFAKVYTPIVCGAALAIVILPSVFIGLTKGDWAWSSNWSNWFSRALMFLVVSCPCALVISIPLSFCGGITAAAKKGILIKGSTYLEALGKTKTAVFDKTGTLTKGNFVVSKIHAVSKEITEEELLAIATHTEMFSTHPISASLRLAHHDTCCDSVKLENVEEIASKGIKATVDGKEVIAGNAKLMEMFSIDFEECDEHKDGTIIHVALNGKYAGHIIITDEIKEDTAAAIADLKKLGVENIVMLTGDNQRTADEVARKIGVTEAYGQLLSADKLSKVEELIEKLGTGRQKKGTLIFTGDGINDAPVLARADAGIAMGAMGSDAAVEAADIIVMEDKISQLVQGIKISRRTLKIVYENLIGSLSVKGLILVLSAAGISNMWVAVFGDVGVTFLAVMNCLRLLKSKKE